MVASPCSRMAMIRTPMLIVQSACLWAVALAADCHSAGCGHESCKYAAVSVRTLASAGVFTPLQSYRALAQVALVWRSSAAVPRQPAQHMPWKIARVDALDMCRMAPASSV